MIELGIAPIGWTNDDLPEIGGDITFEQCISEMALAGYKGCEVGTKFPKNNLPLLKKQLDLRNLRICNQWFSYEFSSQSFKTVKSNFKSHLNFLKYWSQSSWWSRNWKFYTRKHKNTSFFKKRGKQRSMG